MPWGVTGVAALFAGLRRDVRELRVAALALPRLRPEPLPDLRDVPDGLR